MSKIAFDIDGVIADVITPFRLHLRRDFGIDIEGHIDRFNFLYKLCPPFSNIEDCLDYFYSIMKDHPSRVPLHTGVREAFNLLKENGYTYLNFITSRIYEMKEPTENWFKYHFPDIEAFIWHCPYHTTPKIEIIRNLEITHFVEDRLKNVNEISPYIEKVYMITHSWNKGRNINSNVIKCKNVLEAVEHYLFNNKKGKDD